MEVLCGGQGKVVADTEVLWWDVRLDCVTVAKFNNWSVASLLLSHQQARQLRKGYSSSPDLILKKQSLPHASYVCFLSFFTLPPFFSTASM